MPACSMTCSLDIAQQCRGILTGYASACIAQCSTALMSCIKNDCSSAKVTEVEGQQATFTNCESCCGVLVTIQCSVNLPVCCHLLWLFLCLNHYATQGHTVLCCSIPACGCMHMDGTRNTASKGKSALLEPQHLGPRASAKKPAEQMNSLRP